MKDSFWQWEELFIGSCLQFPLYFIVGWSVLPIALICGIFWRLGGWSGGNKFLRRIGVPLTVCLASMAFGVSWIILLAVPFMVWLAPSYGKNSWLFKIVKSDFLARLICFFWYWTAFGIAFIATKYALSV
jgi:hypothetical protein